MSIERGVLEIISKAVNVVRNYPLCDRCLGRMFGMLGRGWTNVERGKAIKTLLLMSLHRCVREEENKECLSMLEALAPSLYSVSPRLYEELGIKGSRYTCPLCLDKFDEIVKRVVEKGVKILNEYDAESFHVGARLSEELRVLESRIISEYGLVYAESLAAELRREIGKRIREHGFRVDFQNPDVVLLVEYPSGSVSVTVNPILVLGFYEKLGRRISQSSWITRFGVKRYPFSVQDAYTPLLELYEGASVVIHAAGREDVDVRMLGFGRPIVVEVKEPRRRRVNVKLAEKTVNEMWFGLFRTRLVSRTTRSFMKSTVKGIEGEERHSKIYRAVVYVPEGIEESDLKKLEEFFRGRVVRQRTPKRVRHRRADIIRERKVYEVQSLKLSEYHFIALIRAEGGLYIKELVSGEDTWPGFPDALGKSSYCVELDVVHVESKLRVKEGSG